jgi:hypothetical protein
VAALYNDAVTRIAGPRVRCLAYFTSFCHEHGVDDVERGVSVEREKASPLPLPSHAAVEFDCALHGFDGEPVGVAAVGFEHAHEVAGVGDGAPEALADRLVVGAAAEVVEAAGTGWFKHDLDLAGVALERDHGLATGGEPTDVERPVVGPAGV